MYTKLLIPPLLLALCSLDTIAEEQKIQIAEPSVPVVISPTRPFRPRDASPYESNLECYYNRGTLSFYFGTPEGTAQLEIINFETAQSITETFSSGQIHYTYIGTDPGTYSILVTTDHNEYSATIVME